MKSPDLDPIPGLDHFLSRCGPLDVRQQRRERRMGDVEAEEVAHHRKQGL
jgi:hypothetical protein